MPTDTGLRFHVTIESADGTRVSRDTNDRREFLAWIDHQVQAGETVLALGVTATEAPAIKAFLASLTAGASRLDPP